MPVPSPFHPRTQELCTSYAWKEWAGYLAVRSYDTYFEREYHAFRQSAGLLDVTPLCKYAVRGPQAAEFLSWLTVRDVSKLATGRVTYLCWCDEHGKALDDGTITCRAPGDYRLTSADPSYAWLLEQAQGFEVEIEDECEQVAALALQGPRSRTILTAAARERDRAALEELRFFRATAAEIAGVSVEITRTGYTGDLGYEFWIPNEGALPVWDALMDAGAPHGLLPAGLDALDVTRIEAGFILGGVDYTSARKAMIEDQTSSPYEIGLGWCVNLDRPPFLGRDALRREKREGSRWATMGIAVDWPALKELYDDHDLPPALCAHAWRESIPIYEGERQVGYATSGAWSPRLKEALAIVTLELPYANAGTRLAMEWTVEHRRHRVPATVRKRPFFDPPRKRSRA